MKSVAKGRAVKPRTPAPSRDTAAGKDAVNAAIGLFNRRWVLRVLWELRQGPMTFRVLRKACGDLSPTVLNARLGELRDARLVSHTTAVGYALTATGAELLVAMRPMLTWAIRWQRTVARKAGPRTG